MSDVIVADFDAHVLRADLELRASQGSRALKSIGASADVPVAVIMRNDLAQFEIMRAAAQAVQ